jgi:hypothetical protein
MGLHRESVAKVVAREVASVTVASPTFTVKHEGQRQAGETAAILRRLNDLERNIAKRRTKRARSGFKRGGTDSPIRRASRPNARP